MQGPLNREFNSLLQNMMETGIHARGMIAGAPAVCQRLHKAFSFSVSNYALTDGIKSQTNIPAT